MIIKFSRWVYTCKGEIIYAAGKPKQTYLVEENIQQWLIENEIPYGFDVQYYHVDEYWCFNSIFAQVTESQALMAKLVWGNDISFESDML